MKAWYIEEKHINGSSEIKKLPSESSFKNCMLIMDYAAIKKKMLEHSV